jgi:hypothetical protein
MVQPKFRLKGGVIEPTFLLLRTSTVSVEFAMGWLTLGRPGPDTVTSSSGSC